MANINLLAPKLLKLEGGFVNDKDDQGGITGLGGITIGTWKRYGHSKDADDDIDIDDMKLLDVNDFKFILKIGYWDECKGDLIKSQSVAEIFVDWYYLSGTTAAKEVQKIVGVKPDGEVGKDTIAAINATDPATLHARITQERLDHFARIVAAKPTQKKYIKGWTNRVLSYKFVS